MCRFFRNCRADLLRCSIELSFNQPSTWFTGAFYGSGVLSLRFDNFIMVAHEEQENLGSWTDKAYPENAVCATLSSDKCVFYDFDREKSLADIPHEIHVDGPSGNDASLVKWAIEHSDDSRRAVVEKSGYGVQIEEERDACQRQYGTYLTLTAAREIESPELLISFRMKVSDHHSHGVGLMLRVQSALPGFRPTPSYYRYSWGESADGREPCEGLLYHNGGKGRFEAVASEPSEREAAQPFRVNDWHRIEVFVTNDMIAVTRDGSMVGQPIRKPNGAPGLRLSFGDVALYCGGHSGGANDACSFDDVLIVDAAYAREAVVWDEKALPADALPLTRPPSERPIYTLDHALWANTRWEGVREWTVAYTRDRQKRCAPNGVSYSQKVAIEFYEDGRFVIFAHQVSLGALPDKQQGGADEDNEQWYVFAENRMARVAADYEGHRDWPRLVYTHPGSDTTHCMIFKVDERDLKTAHMYWSIDDAKCSSPPVGCGYSAELTRLGDVSRQYPPTLRITDPPPDANEQWTVGQNQTVTLRATNAHQFKARVLVQLKSHEDPDATLKLNRMVDFERDEADQWLTGNVKLYSSILVDDSMLLGRNSLTFELRGVDVADVSVATDVIIECKVCMAADAVGVPASQCRYTCSDPAGCADDRCNIGKIHCSHRFTGWDVNGYCTRWSRDRAAMCLPQGGCAPLDAYHMCDFDGNHKKPVIETRCGSPQCRKNCEEGTKVPLPTAAYESGEVSLVCETDSQTAACRAPARCRDGGFCLTDTDAPTPRPPGFTAPPTPEPTVQAPPIDDVVVLPVCRQCVDDFGEPGSQLWCTCCAYDCNNARDNCVQYNGFCSSRCIEDDNSRFCDWQGAPLRAPVFDAATPLPNDDDDVLHESAGAVEPNGDDSDDGGDDDSDTHDHHHHHHHHSDDDESDEKSAEETKQHFKFNSNGAPPPRPNSPTQPLFSAADDNDDDSSSNDSNNDNGESNNNNNNNNNNNDINNDNERRTEVVAADSDPPTKQGAPVTSLVLGALILLAVVAGIVLSRRFSTQRPVDSGDHIA